MSDRKQSAGNPVRQSLNRPRRKEREMAVARLMYSMKLNTFRDAAFSFVYPLKHLLRVSAGFVVLIDNKGDQTYLLSAASKYKNGGREISLSAPLTRLLDKACASNRFLYRNLLPENVHVTLNQSKQLKIKNILLLPIRIVDKTSVLYAFINKPGRFTRLDMSTVANTEKFIKAALLSESSVRSLQKSGSAYRKWIDYTDAEKTELQKRALTSSHLASIGELASGIAHEVNNPLASIVLYTQLLMEEDLPQKTKIDIMAIHESAVRAITIIRRLLTFARQQLQQKIPTDINEMVDVTLELRKYALETLNIEVTTELAPDLPLTLADAGQIQQVFLNIVLNAESEIKLSRGEGRLLIKTELIDNRIKVSFTDDGPGIAQENLSKIFDPFFTTREVGDGTGLGLSICHGIVADHDGKIYAESEPGKGATFTIEIPVVPCQRVGMKDERVQSKTLEARKRRILIVDDEFSILDSLSRLLVKHGYIVDTIDNCVPAQAMIMSKKYDLVLLDIKLPGMSGIELYKEIQKTDAALVRKIAFITGNIMERDTRQFLQDNNVSYFAKPFEMKQLIKEMDVIFSRQAG